jgi:pyrimidine deaminase RibD-like protein
VPATLQHPYDWDRVPASVRDLFVEDTPREEKRRFMRKAIAAARRSPFHPSVGAVVVRDRRVVTTGHRASLHVEGAGGDRRTRSLHAEEMALGRAPADLEGATLYTTLEPCFDRSTPGFEPGIEPCCSIIVRRRIHRVVIGLMDHEPRNLGKGAAYLAANGVRLEFAYQGMEADLYAVIGSGRFWHDPPGLMPWRRPLRRLIRSLRRRMRRLP